MSPLLRLRRDHPREYGENAWLSKSSPTQAGIIPANTGRIGRGYRHGRPLPDHPREYGENAL